VFNGLSGQDLKIRGRLPVGYLVNRYYPWEWVRSAGTPARSSLLLHQSLCLADSYFGKQMPEIVTIVQLGVLPSLGTEKEAGKGSIYHILLVGNA
jgi:hypothetical protein